MPCLTCRPAPSLAGNVGSSGHVLGHGGFPRPLSVIGCSRVPSAARPKEASGDWMSRGSAWPWIGSVFDLEVHDLRAENQGEVVVAG